MHQQALTYEVRHLVCDRARCPDEGVVALVILHLHLKEPCETKTGDIFGRGSDAVVLRCTAREARRQQTWRQTHIYQICVASNQFSRYQFSDDKGHICYS